MTIIAKHVRITGRVQGVAFRAWTQSEAERLGLSGWVRNEPDGSVRALLAGPAAEVKAMLRTLEDGPAAARVTAVHAEDAEADPALGGFRITR